MSFHSSALAAADPFGPRDYDEPEPGRLRVYLTAALGPLVTGYVIVAALLASVTATADLTEFSTVGVLSGAIPGWFAAYQVPLTLGGLRLGVLPLLPTLLMAWLVSRATTGAAERLDASSVRLASRIVLVIAGAHAVAGGVLAGVIMDDPVTVSMLAGMVIPAALAAFVATLTLAARGFLADVFALMDETVVRGLRLGAFALVALLAAGALVLTFGLATSVPAARQLFEQNAPGAGDGFGMLLLSLGYLPNAVVAGTAFMAGSGIGIGELSLDPFNLLAGPVPGIPLLAALPATVATWWPLLLLLPLGIGVFIGWMMRAAFEDPMARLRVVVIAAAVAAAGCVVLGAMAGGRLAGGPFSPVTFHPWSLGLAALVWIALPAAVVVWWCGARPEPDPSRGLIDDAIDAEDADAETDNDAGTDAAGTGEDTDDTEADAEADLDDDPAADPDDDPDDDPDEDPGDDPDEDPAAHDEADEPETEAGPADREPGPARQDPEPST